MSSAINETLGIHTVHLEETAAYSRKSYKNPCFCDACKVSWRLNWLSVKGHSLSKMPFDTFHSQPGQPISYFIVLWSFPVFWKSRLIKNDFLDGHKEVREGWGTERHSMSIGRHISHSRHLYRRWHKMAISSFWDCSPSLTAWRFQPLASCWIIVNLNASFWAVATKDVFFHPLLGCAGEWDNSGSNASSIHLW